MSPSQIHADNAVWWNETASWYAPKEVDEGLETLRVGGNLLDESERELLGDLATWCGRAIHLQCSHGREALSLLNLGAREVVGVDISDKMLEAARRRSDELGAKASWVCSDVLNAPTELDATADLVYTGKGATCWMMDLDAWAAVVVRLLKPGGRFFIYEGHPLDWVWDTNAAGYQLDAHHGDYFDQGYRDRAFMAKTQNQPHYRQWTLADTMNSLIRAGLIIDHLGEYSEPFWGQFPNIPNETLKRLPHTFSILAHKS